MWETFKKLAFKVFGRSLDPLVDYFENLKPDIEKSGIPLSLEEYVYVMFFCTLLTFIVEFPLLSFIAGLFFPAPFAFFLSLTTSLVLSLIVFFFFYVYPAFVTNRRAKKIDASLPFISLYLSSLTASGIPPVSMFKLLASFKEYKEVSKEARKIWRDMDYFGMSFEQAVKRAAMRTPSRQFKEMLLGLLAVTSSGTDVSKYFKEKAREYMNEYTRKLEGYSRNLSLLVEIYLTLVTVGSIFFVVVTAIMSAFGTGSSLSLIFAQFLVVFVFLPLISLVFILVAEFLAPGM